MTTIFCERPFIIHSFTQVTLCSKGKGGEPAFHFQTPGKKKWDVLAWHANVTHSSMVMVPPGQTKDNWKESIVATTEILDKETNIWDCFLRLKEYNSSIELVEQSGAKRAILIKNGFDDKSCFFRTLLFIVDRCLFTLTYCTRKPEGKAACEAYLPMPTNIATYIKPPSSQ